jgi:hypothetical protein
MISAVFFLRRQRVFDRPQSADLFIDLNQILAQFPEAVELCHFLLRLAQGDRRGEGLGNSLTLDLPRQSVEWAVSRIAIFPAMTAGVSATSSRCRN